jgi:hypothetical protein
MLLRLASDFFLAQAWPNGRGQVGWETGVHFPMHF